ncbi:hypothetical protein JTE90_028905 [Oedothorax gibbosus]|uniref:E3 ubiquitin-protein ligase SHPRH n=1 Tax=Oedothorax gibbosus TaxID=931172 RepID=A0AAV6UQI6_9ARAC|nr:hypothetical protein JTE90_028905 [Oedothorax gibbosus]
MPKRRLKAKDKWSKKGPWLPKYLEEKTTLMNKYIKIDRSQDCRYSIGRIVVLFKIPSTGYLTTNILYFYTAKVGEEVVLIWEKVDEFNEKKVEFNEGRWKIVGDDEIKITDLFKYIVHGDYFNLVIDSDKSSENCMYLDVCINSKLFSDLTFASERVSFSESRLSAYIVLSKLNGFYLEATDHERILKEIQRNFSNCFEAETEDIELSVEEVYSFILNSYKANIDAGVVTHPFLIPKLREYQKQAVNWMLHAEKRLDCDLNDLHAFYEEFQTRDGFTLYYHKYRGLFVTERFTKLPMCKGGILADEMGLGKTIEVLACILLNPRKDIDVAIQPGLCKQNLDVRNYNSGSLPLSNGNVFQKSPGKRLSQSTSKNRKKRKNQLSSADENKVSDQDYNLEENLECVCGKKFDFDDLLHCSKCGLKQHATCVLAQPDVSDVNYLCPYCWVDPSMKPVKSRSTLIVSPSVILSQWNQEIEKHIEKGKLKVLQYLGIDHHKFINPVDLADHDIVLSSYEIFRKELSHVNVPHGETQRSLRHAKVFRTLPSPLLAVEWWRICLDEAQMVESIVSRTAQMAVEVPSINRWCVTGTPLQKSFEDLHGLIYFLNLDPYLVKEWWSELISLPATKYGDYKNLHSILNTVMWRTSKNSVLNQINIPKQETIIHYVNFTKIEKVFYNDVHKVCQKEFAFRFGYMADVELRFLHHTDLKRLLTPLRNLQKACCHFQLTGGKFADIQKKKMTVDELHEFLIKKAKYEAEEVNRSLIAGLNGLAGCFAIKGDYIKSCITYKNILKSVAETDAHIRTDALQLIHTNHNFANIASILYSESQNLDEVKEVLGTEDIHSFIEDLNAKYNNLCKSYLQKFQEQINTCKNVVFDANEKIKKIQSQFKCEKKTLSTSMWWMNILESLNDSEKEVFIDRIKELLMNAPGRHIVSGKVSVSDNFTDASGLRYQLVTLADQLQEARLSAKQAVDCAFSTPVETALNNAIACHLRRDPDDKSKHKCLYCLADWELKQYESKLFRFDDEKTFETKKRNRRGRIESNTEDSLNEKEPTRRGCHADSELEIILKEFLHYNGPYFEEKPMCMEDGENERQYFLSLKSEFKALKLAWQTIFDYVSALDELEMTKTAMRLLLPDEEKPKVPLANVLRPEELPVKVADFELEIKEDEIELKNKLRHLAYMQNLKKKKDLQEEFCQICHEPFEDSWRVLQCGHSYCIPCIHQLCLMQNEQKFPCPVCRQVTTFTDIYYANKCVGSETDSPKDPFKGYYSAKVSSVVTCLRDIQEKDETAKTIVFSHFSDFLEILAESLKDNNIYFASIKDKKSFDLKANKIKKFEIFKQNPRVNVLLIPLQMGANGINIIEATHVILVEPVMDYSKVLQAIGRVHRIGQTKQTYVHKFVIRNTIEEKIYEIYDKNICNSGISTPICFSHLICGFENQRWLKVPCYFPYHAKPMPP